MSLTQFEAISDKFEQFRQVYINFRPIWTILVALKIVYTPGTGSSWSFCWSCHAAWAWYSGVDFGSGHDVAGGGSTK